MQPILQHHLIQCKYTNIIIKGYSDPAEYDIIPNGDIITGNISTFFISIYSRGNSNNLINGETCSFVKVNGVDVLNGDPSITVEIRRGINVVVLDPINGSLIGQYHVDTFDDISLDINMANFLLTNTRTGDHILFTVYDTAFSRKYTNTMNVLSDSDDSTITNGLGYREPFIFIGSNNDGINPPSWTYCERAGSWDNAILRKFQIPIFGVNIESQYEIYSTFNSISRFSTKNISQLSEYIYCNQFISNLYSNYYGISCDEFEGYPLQYTQYGDSDFFYLYPTGSGHNVILYGIEDIDNNAFVIESDFNVVESFVLGDFGVNYEYRGILGECSSDNPYKIYSPLNVYQNFLGKNIYTVDSIEIEFFELSPLYTSLGTICYVSLDSSPSTLCKDLCLEYNYFITNEDYCSCGLGVNETILENKATLLNTEFDYISYNEDFNGKNMNIGWIKLLYCDEGRVSTHPNMKFELANGHKSGLTMDELSLLIPYAITIKIQDSNILPNDTLYNGNFSLKTDICNNAVFAMNNNYLLTYTINTITFAQGGANPNNWIATDYGKSWMGGWCGSLDPFYQSTNDETRFNLNMCMYINCNAYISRSNKIK